MKSAPLVALNSQRLARERAQILAVPQPSQTLRGMGLMSQTQFFSHAVETLRSLSLNFIYSAEFAVKKSAS
jgi:hypothetical protein